MFPTVVLLAASLSTASAASVPQNSLTLSPIHLTGPIVELSYERALTEVHAVQAIAGAGQLQGFSAYEGGAQYRAYLLGDFGTGLGLGAEVLGVSVSGSGATGTGMAAGPLVTAKATAGFGLTGVLDVGYQWGTASASGNGQTASGSMGGLLLNLNVGWSF